MIPRRVASNAQWGEGYIGVWEQSPQTTAAGGVGQSLQQPEAWGSGGGAPVLENFCFFFQKLNFRSVLIKNNGFETWHRNWQCKHN